MTLIVVGLKTSSTTLLGGDGGPMVRSIGYCLLIAVS